MKLVLEYEFHTAQSFKEARCHQHMPTPANINTAAVGIRKWKKIVADIALGRKKNLGHTLAIDRVGLKIRLLKAIDKP